MWIGTKVVFTSYEDLVWGEKYAGKVGEIIELTVDEYDEFAEIKVRFEDGQCIGMGSNEVVLVEGELDKLATKISKMFSNL